MGLDSKKDVHLDGSTRGSVGRLFDSYWYPHHSERALPVLRVGFDNAAESWFHIDPATGYILDRTDETRRSYRWLFHALHSLDFALLLDHRPAWDIVVWLLSLIGMVISTGGIVIGWQRLRRHGTAA
ncbi:hypothetical protein [Bradyrhizobium sp. 45]|uniref:hypothetical protein n=1 Tax=Bradyrhizobium sp. 45 TaxID=1043587 RepID=UPI003211B9E4|nr:hypothetical protein [Bradyrhizobium sp. 45]